MASEPLEVRDAELVLAQNAHFYRAIERMDLRSMSECWTCTDSDVCIHPGWQVITGWTEILDTWAAIFQGAAFMKFEITEAQVHLHGDLARVHCVENIYTLASGLQSHSVAAATNLFVRHGGRWLLTLHHASPVSHSVSHTEESDEPLN